MSPLLEPYRKYGYELLDTPQEEPDSSSQGPEFTHPEFWGGEAVVCVQRGNVVYLARDTTALTAPTLNGQFDHEHQAQAPAQDQDVEDGEMLAVYDFSTHKYLNQRPSNSPVSSSPASTSSTSASAFVPLAVDIMAVRDAGACLHTHSQAAVMCSLLFDTEFRISNIDHISTIPRATEPGYMSFSDTLVIPIIDRTSDDQDLAATFQEALHKHPEAPAVIVRRQGIYVWGANVAQTTALAQSIDYLLELTLKMESFKIRPDGGIGSERATRSVSPGPVPVSRKAIAVFCIVVALIFILWAIGIVMT